MAAKKKDKTEYNVTPEQFIEAWQTSDSAEEVSKKLKMPKDIVAARLCNYRKKGIPLKRMKRTRKDKLDTEKLKAHAMKTAEDHGVPPEDLVMKPKRPTSPKKETKPARSSKEIVRDVLKGMGRD